MKIYTCNEKCYRNDENRNSETNHSLSLRQPKIIKIWNQLLLQSTNTTDLWKKAVLSRTRLWPPPTIRWGLLERYKGILILRCIYHSYINKASIPASMCIFSLQTNLQFHCLGTTHVTILPYLIDASLWFCFNAWIWEVNGNIVSMS